MRSAALTTTAFATVALVACSGETADESGAAPEPVTTEMVAASPSPSPSQAVDPESDSAGANDEARAEAGKLQDSIPARFHGDWSENLNHCTTPGHQRYDIRADEVGFFESRGIVQDVRVDGNYAAATLSEQYGDAPPAVYVFYMAIESSDTMRIRYDNDPRIRIYRCP